MAVFFLFPCSNYAKSPAEKVFKNLTGKNYKKFIRNNKTIALFNGKDLKNWTAWTKKSEKRESAADKVYHTENGMVRLYGQSGYLMTSETYKDFVLTFSFRWNKDTTLWTPHKKSRRNSGVMYRVDKNYPDSWFPKGIQYQIKEKTTGDMILLKNAEIDIEGKHYGPGRSVLVPCKKNLEKPAGKWNKCEIIAYKGTLYQFLNGKLAICGFNCSEKDGKILLCCENAPIDFKDINLTIIK